MEERKGFLGMPLIRIDRCVDILMICIDAALDGAGAALLGNHFSLCKLSNQNTWPSPCQNLSLLITFSLCLAETNAA